MLQISLKANPPAKKGPVVNPTRRPPADGLHHWFVVWHRPTTWVNYALDSIQWSADVAGPSPSKGRANRYWEREDSRTNEEPCGFLVNREKLLGSCTIPQTLGITFFSLNCTHINRFATKSLNSTNVQYPDSRTNHEQKMHDEYEENLQTWMIVRERTNPVFVDKTRKQAVRNVLCKNLSMPKHREGSNHNVSVMVVVWVFSCTLKSRKKVITRLRLKVMNANCVFL